MSIWNVYANYDAEARVWYAIEGDIPGLAVDAETLEELEVKVGNMLDDLLEIHADDFSDKSRLVDRIRSTSSPFTNAPMPSRRSCGWSKDTRSRLSRSSWPTIATWYGRPKVIISIGPARSQGDRSR